MSSPVEEIRWNGILLGIIARWEFTPIGLQFLTGEQESLQFGIYQMEKGHKVKPHIHRLVKREVAETQEVLHIMEGRIEVTFYSEGRFVVRRFMLEDGDTVWFGRGGHSIEALGPSIIVYSKQGPYNPQEKELI